MALSVKVGTFACPVGGIGTTLAVTGVGFQPKALILWWAGRTEAVSASGEDDHVRGIGFATSPTSRYCFSTVSLDFQSSAGCESIQRNNACASFSRPYPENEGRLDLQSFDADGFTVIVDAATGVGHRVSYLALGGDSITNVGTTTFTEYDGTGTQDYTGLGFQPSLVLICCIGHDSWNVWISNSQVDIGWATANGQNGLLTAGGQDSVATTNTYHTSLSPECGEQIAGGFSGSEHSRFELDSFLSNGFRLNWLEGNNDAHLYGVLAIAGISARVGEMLSATNTTPFSITGVGFQPKAVAFLSAGRPENVVDTIANHDGWSVGAGDGSSQVAHAVVDVDAMSDTVVATAIDYANVYVSLEKDSSPNVEGKMALDSLNGDGFTVHMTDADPAQRFVSYLALGEPAASGGEYGGNLSLLGVGA